MFSFNFNRPYFLTKSISILVIGPLCACYYVFIILFVLLFYLFFSIFIRLENYYNLHPYITINQKLINFNSVALIKDSLFQFHHNFIIMTSKYHSIVSLYLKHTPHHSKKAVETNFHKAEIETRK